MNLKPLTLSCAALLFATNSLPAQNAGVAAGGPKALFDPGAPDAIKQLSLNDNCEGDVTYTVDKEGVEVTVKPNSKSSFPGVKITPPTPWDATGFGHIEVKVTNEGTKNIRANLVIYNAGGSNRSNANIITVKPGQSLVLPVIFNYSYDNGSYELHTDAIVNGLVFIGKSDTEQKFRFGALVADGPKGEKPVIAYAPVDPAKAAYFPKDGYLWGGTVGLDAKQITAKGAKAEVTHDGKSLHVDFRGSDQVVTVKPAIGKWNLNRFLEVHLKIKNTGNTPISPGAALSAAGAANASTDVFHPKAPIAPGAEGEIVIPFQAQTLDVYASEPAQLDFNVKKEWTNTTGGTKFRSNTVMDLVLVSDKDSSNQSFDVVSATGFLPTFNRPDWFGKKPPVPGDWVQTFNDDFNGNKIDDHTWNIYTDGEWHLGAKDHYSKDGVIVKDGNLNLELSMKHGHHEDNPEYMVSDRQTGWADTFGKWTQRYGYFEARMKLPTAPNMFLAWWLMPDYGQGNGSIHDRTNTKLNPQSNTTGMEFDIMETLSIWGPYRHDFGMHWDNYATHHKSNGDFQFYVTPDKDGYITVGMLWLPGMCAMYDNGVEVARWDSPRVANSQEHMILDLISGGWESEPLDEKQLPADFTIDYVRVWQRKDLATPQDGYKPNNGGPLPPMTPEEIKERQPKP
jgi:beta-glucanase (GH16 family)